MIENKMVVDSQWRELEKSGLENVVAQPEHAGNDFYGTEILEGDEVAVDTANFHEEILKEHLKRYLIEQLHFIFRGGLVLDRNRNSAFSEVHLESYLSDYYQFEFKTAE